MSFVKDVFSATGVGSVLGIESSAEKAAKQAAKEQSDAAQTGIDEQRRQFDLTQESLRPFQEAGVNALAQQQALLGIGTPEEQAQAIAALNETPGQQFLRDRQQKALLRNSSAIGGLGGGNVRTGLQQQAVGFAQQDLQNQFGRLGQLAGQGQSAATNVGQFGAQAVGNIANLQGAGSQARASGIFGAQQAKTDQFGNLLQLAGGFI